MPAIHLIWNKGKPNERSEWQRIHHQQIDKDGYLHFSLEWTAVLFCGSESAITAVYS